MESVSVKVLNKGQIVIPAAIRKKCAIKPGNQVQMFWGETWGSGLEI
jgi:AbrB family looped-hinge helix DNA binding protein